MINKALPSGILSWIPYSLKTGSDGPVCKWLYTDHIEFSEPFFSESIARCKSASPYSGWGNSLSNLAVLPEWAASVPAVLPSAFIFHISRCGSTLVSQALGLKEEHIVLAEVPFLDELLRFSEGDRWPEELDRAQILRAAIALYGQNRNGKKKKLFIKTDSWHIYFLPLLRHLYPRIPFVLLYRRPDEVLWSQQKKRGMHAIPGLLDNHLLGLEEGSGLNLDEHMARVLRSYLNSFLEIAQNDADVLLVNYMEGVESIVNQIADLTGVFLDEDELERIRARGRFDAKYPDQTYVEEIARDEVPDYLKSAFQLYEELERLRIYTAKQTGNR